MTGNSKIESPYRTVGRLSLTPFSVQFFTLDSSFTELPKNVGLRMGDEKLKIKLFSVVGNAKREQQN